MARYYKVISGDGHVETPPESWVKYVPTKYQDRAPRLIKLSEGGEGWIVEGQPLLHNGQNITGAKTLAPKATTAPMLLRNDSYFNQDGSAAPGAGNAAQRLREQDQDGLDAEVLFPPVFATRFVEGINDKQAYLSMVQAYNTFLGQDFCSYAPDRLIGNGIIPVTGVGDAVAEMKRCKELGIKSVSFHQFPNGTPMAYPREDDLFWDKALEWNMALSPHGGFGGNFGTAGAPPVGAGTGGIQFPQAIMQRAQGPVYGMVHLMVNGTLDRFPNLRIYLAETNVSWMPWSLFALDDSYKMFNQAFDQKLKMLPSEYVRKHFLFSFIRDVLAMKMRDFVPVENLMWGSDFPHSVGSFPNSQEWIDVIFEGVPADIRKKVLLDVPAEYFGLDTSKPITETAAVEKALAR